MKPPLRIGVTMGDPAGIGPEILLAAFEKIGNSEKAGALQLIAIGTASVLERTASSMSRSVRITLPNVTDIYPEIALVESARESSPISVGRISSESGRLAFAAVRKAIELAMAGEIDAIVTNPISKEAINLGGHRYNGHTEILTDLTGSSGNVMMLAHGNLRVTHMTTHMALADVPRHITPARLTRVLELTSAALADLGVQTPRIAVAGLNPHAGEGGLFGGEDEEVLAPVIARFRSAGHDVTGPLPGDTVFVRAVGGEFDAVVAMYHDQGHIPVKLLGFRIDPLTKRWVGLSGVNVTLGLPIVRTSVDHGTAFDIAGRGIANPQSLIEAIEYAARMVEGRQRSRTQHLEASPHRDPLVSNQFSLDK